jgi:hypothetical protein
MEPAMLVLRTNQPGGNQVVGNHAIIKRTCPHCRGTFTITMPAEAYRKWEGGSLIQDAWPEGTADQREMIITGLHPKCYEALTQEGSE